MRARRLAGLAVTALAVTALVLAAARRWLRVVVVEGASMAPTYSDGDRLIALYAGRRLRVAEGDVVVVQAPDPQWTTDRGLDQAHLTLVKRVVAVTGADEATDTGGVPSGTVYVQGDAPGGYDSTVFGALPRPAVLGRVLFRLGAGRPDTRGRGS